MLQTKLENKNSSFVFLIYTLYRVKMDLLTFSWRGAVGVFPLVVPGVCVCCVSSGSSIGS